MNVKKTPPVLTDADEDNSSSAAFGLSASDRTFLIVIIMICFGTYAAKQIPRWFASDDKLQIVRLSQESALYQLEINSATWVEWMQLDGIGELTARNIVADREENGPFQSIDDVQRVKGIGAVTLKKMEPHLRCDSSGSEVAPISD